MNWGFNLLLMFGAMQWVSFGRVFLAGVMGEWVNDVAGYLNAGSVLVVALAAAWYAWRHGNPLIVAARIWFLAVLTLVLALAARGLWQGVIPRFVIYDTIAYGLILSFVIIGAIPQAFEDMRRVWVYVIAASIPLNLAALTDLTALLGELQTGERIARDTMSYRTQNALDVVVLMVPFAFALSGWRWLVVVTGFGLVLAQQVLYQKRLDAVYFLLVLAATAWCWSRGPRVWRAELRAKFLRMVGLLAAGAAVLLVVGGNYVIPQFASLMDRLSGQSADIHYSSGFLRYLALENERFEIVADCFRHFTPIEWIFGRGMGSGVEWIGFNPAALQGAEMEQIWAAYYLPDYGFFGRRVFEVGVMTLVLKGGALLFAVYYSAFALLGARRRWLRQSLTGRLCLWVVALQLLYSIVGGDFMMSAAFQMATTAACLGVGLSRFASVEARP
ncbi:MAG: hypothetical protein JNK23_11485 [Opitutaceae bacterium]|nr:hypothetical protein [Opitutaceae bacterium]